MLAAPILKESSGEEMSRTRADEDIRNWTAPSRSSYAARSSSDSTAEDAQLEDESDTPEREAD